MLNRLLVLQVAVVFLTVQAGMVFAAGIADTGPGCGLGKIVWADSSNADSVGGQLFISTTNNTILPWQAFGITSGTLGCKNNGKVWAERKVNAFASINFEPLSQEMAQGGGEYLASLATLMGVPEAHQAEFFALAQEQYASLIQSEGTSPDAMVKALREAMAGHPVLASASVTR